jgi:hypothetical protein
MTAQLALEASNSPHICTCGDPKLTHTYLPKGGNVGRCLALGCDCTDYRPRETYTEELRRRGKL